MPLQVQVPPPFLLHPVLQVIPRGPFRYDKARQACFVSCRLVLVALRWLLACRILLAVYPQDPAALPPLTYMYVFMYTYDIYVCIPLTLRCSAATRTALKQDRAVTPITVWKGSGLQQAHATSRLAAWSGDMTSNLTHLYQG